MIGDEDIAVFRKIAWTRELRDKKLPTKGKKSRQRSYDCLPE